MSFRNLAGVRPRNLRGALLGAVAIVALGGVALETAPQLSNAATTATTSIAPAGPASFADVVDRVKGAVVSVKVKISDTSDEQSQTPQMPDLQPGSPLYRFFHQFGEGQDDFPGARRHPHLEMAQGSGFFISPDGYIVTNNHVVDHATDVTVTTVDGKSIPAKVIGTDPKTDLALLKVKQGGDYPYVTFADQAPRVGDWVIAVGNPFGLGGTVTAGIVSARGRDIGSGPYDDFLQIDAPVNRGNSGGPTFNGEGQVVGVNTAIFSPSGGSVGIGFAIEADVVKSVVQALKDHGSVTRGWLGVEIQPVTGDIADSLGIKEASGALVSRAQPNSPAAQAGVKAGDVITSVNGEHVSDPRELARKIAQLGPNKTAELGVVRDGANQTINVKLATMSNEKVAKADATTDSSQDDASQLAKLGLTVEPARGGHGGVRIAEVDPDSVAAQKGLQSGDVIVDAGGKPVSSSSDISAAFDAAKSSGHKAVLLRVKSGDTFHYVALSTQSAS
jgi:serine protease Do